MDSIGLGMVGAEMPLHVIGLIAPKGSECSSDFVLQGCLPWPTGIGDQRYKKGRIDIPKIPVGIVTSGPAADGVVFVDRQRPIGKTIAAIEIAGDVLVEIDDDEEVSAVELVHYVLERDSVIWLQLSARRGLTPLPGYHQANRIEPQGFQSIQAGSQPVQLLVHLRERVDPHREIERAALAL
jgi:hypothetical protein